MRDYLLMLMEGPRTAYVVAASTASAGVGTWFDFIPDDIGKLASAIGLLLSVLVFVLQMRKQYLEEKRFQLELKKYGGVSPGAPHGGYQPEAKQGVRKSPRPPKRS